MVTIYDYDIAKELFSREDLTGRPNNFAYRNRMLGEKQGTSISLTDKNEINIYITYSTIMVLIIPSIKSSESINIFRAFI